MKILIIRNIPSFMDVKNNSYNIQELGLAKALVRRGCGCDILFWTDKVEDIVTIPVSSGGQVQVFYRRGRSLLKNTVFTGSTGLFEKYDILQPCEYNQMQSWILSKKFQGRTVIYHGPYYSPFNKRYNLMCRGFDVIFLKRYIRLHTPFLVKSELAGEFLMHRGIQKENITIAGVGMDEEMLTNDEAGCTSSLCRDMLLYEDGPKILYIGKFESRRNIPFLLEVFAGIHKEEPKARLYLIGDGTAEYVEAVRHQIGALGLGEFIVWEGRLAQKYLSEVYKMADFFLLPTEYEIFGMVLLEAMFYGCVVITTKNGGSETLIADASEGIILEELDADLWVRKFLDLWCDEDRMQTIKRNASKKIASSYTWDKRADCFIHQYEKMLEAENERL